MTYHLNLLYGILGRLTQTITTSVVANKDIKELTAKLVINGIRGGN